MLMAEDASLRLMRGIGMRCVQRGWPDLFFGVTVPWNGFALTAPRAVGQQTDFFF
jgi:hypothetical protein